MPDAGRCELSTSDTIQCLGACLKAASWRRRRRRRGRAAALCPSLSPHGMLVQHLLSCARRRASCPALAPRGVKATLGATFQPPTLLLQGLWALCFGVRASHPLFSQPRDKTKRHQHPAGWAVPPTAPRSSLPPIASLPCARLNFPAAFSSLIKHFYRPSLLAGSESYSPPCSHGNASPGQAALEPVTSPTCGCLFGPGNFPAVWENLGKENPPRRAGRRRGEPG